MIKIFKKTKLSLLFLTMLSSLVLLTPTKSFAFPILDIKVLFQNNKEITNLRIDKENYDISKYNNKWLDKKKINGRTLSINAFRNFSIKSQNILKSVELLILRT